VLRRSLVRRRDTDEQAFVEGTPDEINADRKARSDRTHQARAVSFARTIPHLGCEAGRHSDRWKALLTER
jgi:hypothetical protein